MTHTPYSVKAGREYSFKVKYYFYPYSEGGRKQVPFQGYRSDFWYIGFEEPEKGVYMIWPEFEDEVGEVILDNSKSLNAIGVARMFIVSESYVAFHKERIFIGTKGYFMEGLRKVAECEVIELNF